MGPRPSAGDPAFLVGPQCLGPRGRRSGFHRRTPSASSSGRPRREPCKHHGRAHPVLSTKAHEMGPWKWFHERLEDESEMQTLFSPASLSKTQHRRGLFVCGTPRRFIAALLHLQSCVRPRGRPVLAPEAHASPPEPFSGHPAHLPLTLVSRLRSRKPAGPRCPSETRPPSTAASSSPTGRPAW